jgi:hypothetical protein
MQNQHHYLKFSLLFSLIYDAAIRKLLVFVFLCFCVVVVVVFLIFNNKISFDGEADFS